MQIPILSGVYTDAASDFRVGYPVNLTPVIQGDKGISTGYLRPADGLISEGTGPGASRGGINWRGICYRVMGNRFVSIAANGVVTEQRDVGSGGNVTFDYSFDRLACTAGLRLWYLQPSTLPPHEAGVPGASLSGLGPAFIATSEGAGIMRTSPDGVVWTGRAGSVSTLFSATAWNGSILVAVGNAGNMMTTVDGINWTTRTSGTGVNINDVIWNGSIFCAVCNGGLVLTSPDGVTWTLRPTGVSDALNAVAWNGSIFCAVGVGAIILTSSDGVNWVSRVSGTVWGFNDITWNGALFCVVGSAGGIRTSVDGINWLGASSGTSNVLNGISWNGAMFVVVGNGVILTSPNGADWTIRVAGGWNPMDVTWNGAMFVAVGQLGMIQTSVNGITWTAQVSGTTSSLLSVNWVGFRTGALALSQVTDPNLTPRGAASFGPIDVVWVDGYFVVTDGVSVIVTELNDPTRVNPLKYGSSEIDPDPIVAVEKLRGELHVVNRHTIEVFRNVGGRFFPFQRIEGAMIPRGAVGTHAVCVFGTSLAMIGSGRNEPLSIYLAAGGQTVRIGTRETDTLLRAYTEAQLSTAVVEARIDRDQAHLWVRLPDRTLVYDAEASNAVGQPVWYTLTSALTGFSAYRARDLVWCYDKWLVGDSTGGTVGRLDDRVSTQYGTNVRWEFGTMTLYNEGKGALIHELELVALTGRVAGGVDPLIQVSHSDDGETWSLDRPARAGMQGDRLRRIVWLQMGLLRNWRVWRFRGDSRAFVTLTRLQAKVEGLES